MKGREVYIPVSIHGKLICIVLMLLLFEGRECECMTANTVCGVCLNIKGTLNIQATRTTHIPTQLVYVIKCISPCEQFENDGYSQAGYYNMCTYMVNYMELEY